jgi:hypothetical protein
LIFFIVVQQPNDINNGQQIIEEQAGKLQPFQRDPSRKVSSVELRLFDAM